ncbi:hypothetical protein VZ119_04755 [Enterobacter bugandensis]|uniref:hypothetical protein n=1 Tax=Enterobacter bugandensis TaxID=881260 RepID=UPI002E28FB6E|nr:hypothetical protein [Enterobacter bugandensis]MED5641833.1 hypothetical protein [Enterobacter bugandensis]
MTKNTILFLLPLFSSFSYAGQKNMNQDSLWNIVKELKTVWGKQTEDVSKLFHQPLVQKNPEVKDRYTSVPFTLSDGTRISDLDVRLWGNGDNSVSLVSFVIEQPCITLEQVKTHFPDVKISNIPRGNTAGQSVGYRTVADERGLAWAFSFPVMNQECLNRVVMSRYDR